MKVVTHLLASGGAIPNHPRWPLLVYPAVVADVSPETFERLFTRHRWPTAWRNGVFPFHQFGGDAGVTLTAKRGDVIVLPAGTGHKRISSRGALGIVGAYPEGQHPDTCRPGSKELSEVVLRVPLPACDPVYGAEGPLFRHWR
jgi:uncharacterized protein YjlB